MNYSEVVLNAFPYLKKSNKRKVTSSDCYTDVIQIENDDFISIMKNHVDKTISLDFGKSVFTEEAIVETLVYLEKLGLVFEFYFEEKSHFFVIAKM